jgi:predicted transcriptional regulator
MFEKGTLMEDAGVKEKARKLVDSLPEGSTWDDLMYEIYARQAVEAGLGDAAAGRVVPVEEVRRSFGLPK